MISTDKRVPASGPKNAALAAIGMSPAKQEIASGIPFVGPSGKIFDDALYYSKVPRSKVFVTNLCNFFIDDNDLYSIPQEILEKERTRVFSELDKVQPNCLLIQGAQTLVLLMEGYVGPFGSKTQKKASSKWGITKWRGSVKEMLLPSGRRQKFVVAMHPAAFIRGQWKWFPLYKYIDVPRAVMQSSFPGLNLTSRNAIIGPSFRQAKEYLLEAHQKDWVSIDYEGMSHITCLGVGFSKSEAMCIPLNRVGSANYWTLSEEIEIWRLWTSLLQSGRNLIAQNAAYEWIKSWLYGIYPNHLGIDTMHTHHCLYPDFGGINDEWTKSKRSPDNPGHGLAIITSQYTDQPYYKDDGRHWTPDMGEDKFWRYNALDVMVTYEAAMQMKSELETQGLWNTYRACYLDQFEHTLRMEWIGVKQDLAKRAAVRSESETMIKTKLAELSDLTKLRVISKVEFKGQKPQKGMLNLGSPKQFGEFMYARGYKPRMKYNKKEKKSKVTWDKDTMAALLAKHPDDRLLHLIVDVNKTQDFIAKVLNVKLDENGYIHCHHKLGGTNGTRWSTSESILGSGTNLQNIPRQGHGRNFFLPD